MNEEFRRRVIETLRKGEELPSEWARELFPPERREYELVYLDKTREEDILVDMPFLFSLRAPLGKMAIGKYADPRRQPSSYEVADRPEN